MRIDKLIEKIETQNDLTEENLIRVMSKYPIINFTPVKTNTDIIINGFRIKDVISNTLLRCCKESISLLDLAEEIENDLHTASMSDD